MGGIWAAICYGLPGVLWFDVILLVYLHSCSGMSWSVFGLCWYVLLLGWSVQWRVLLHVDLQFRCGLDLGVKV
ncbi:hypothetical protein LOK49_LG11G00595 [Camellia lanceoleosa]|uniref:Uncharacterized protein n=1 Tax=Camellia lanceoleosa TaxID=1840588 RepID=A0ACC0G2D4_9ERIC|nr:hypothetical protein LOK49_LG11G00595 [Camellia lanceoleosa]